jgi:protein-tyrosine-phosphatase
MTRNVLFLCTGNSARSILAEAILNQLGGGKYAAYSAGSQPKGQVHPGTLRLLESRGYNVSSLRSKSWDEFTGPSGIHFDYIITVCNNAAGEACPVIPGKPAKDHWDIPDPPAAGDVPQAFEQAYRLLTQHITDFIGKAA